MGPVLVHVALEIADIGVHHRRLAAVDACRGMPAKELEGLSRVRRKLSQRVILGGEEEQILWGVCCRWLTIGQLTELVAVEPEEAPAVRFPLRVVVQPHLRWAA